MWGTNLFTVQGTLSLPLPRKLKVNRVRLRLRINVIIQQHKERNITSRTDRHQYLSKRDTTVVYDRQ